jgi:hypothetical protein
MQIKKLNNNNPESGSAATPDINTNAVTGHVDEKKLSSETKIIRRRKSKKRELTPELFKECVREGMIEFCKKLPQILGFDKKRQ